MAENFKRLQNFSEKIPAGSNDCCGLVHMARFLRGYVGDCQDFWIQDRTFWDVSEGIAPISNYEVVSIDLGDLLTPKVLQCIHSPN
jgi:hypothetical protein